MGVSTIKLSSILKDISPVDPPNPQHLRLNKNKRQAIGLIQLGTFLEYFDLYLYIHMAVILNGIFFPKTDPYTAALLSAFTFSSTFLLRPFGALFFGYIGDYFSRKASVVITTMIMAICSFVIASTPSYATLGLSASVIMITCRLLQGFSSVGEIPGARVYITEITSPPYSFYYTTLVNFSAELGALFALMVGSLFLFFDSDEGWRTAFYFGSGISVIGSIARTRLRETSEFLQEKSKASPSFSGRVTKLTQVFSSCRREFLCYLGLECIYPLCFYYCFIYLGDHLRTVYGFTSYEVICNNIYVALLQAVSTHVFARLSLKYNPLMLLRIREIGFLLFSLCLPFIFPLISKSSHILWIQCILGGILGGDAKPAHALFIRSFPIIGRYTQTAIAFALSRAFMYVITSYACVMIGQNFGDMGLSMGLAVFGALALYCALNFTPKDSKDK